MTEHGWFDEDWDDSDEDDLWDVLPGTVGMDGPDHDLPDPPGAALRSGTDALAVLLDLVGPERAGSPALWFVLLDAQDRTIPLVLPIVDVPMRADRAVARRLVAVLDSVLRSDAPGGSVVVGRVRPDRCRGGVPQFVLVAVVPVLVEPPVRRHAHRLGRAGPA